MLTTNSTTIGRRLGAALLVLAGAVGGADAAEDEIGGWAIATATDSLPVGNGQGRWLYWIDMQARYFDLGSGTNQYLVRPALGYSLGNGVSVWAGYARFRSRNRAGSVAYEHRYWQQLSFTAGDWDHGRLTMRARLEQRDVDTGSDLGLVLRYLVKYVRPIGAGGRTDLILGVEPFVALRDTDWGGSSGLRQNRVSVLIGNRVSDRLSIEAGYMNQYVVADAAPDRRNHLAILNFRVKL